MRKQDSVAPNQLSSTAGGRGWRLWGPPCGRGAVPPGTRGRRARPRRPDPELHAELAAARCRLGRRVVVWEIVAGPLCGHRKGQTSPPDDGDAQGPSRIKPAVFGTQIPVL